MESNHGIITADEAILSASPSEVEAGVDEVEAMIAELADRDPAEVAEPAARIAEHLGVLLEAEEDRR